jgi:acetylornithine deacetylase/succinyl-diaminopimelate desuccinylase family protein
MPSGIRHGENAAVAILLFSFAFNFLLFTFNFLLFTSGAIMNHSEIITQLRARRPALLGYLSDLIAARTENPPGDEHRAARVVEAFCRRLNLPCEIREQVPGRSNIIARLGRGRPRFAVACHLDTVPAGEGWLTDPFVATPKGDLIYGRGTNDNKGQMAATMLAIEFLKEREADLDGEILMMGVADEERGSAFGTRFLLEAADLQNLDGAIIPDAGHLLETLDVAEKGLLFLKITCHGRQAHGSTPDLGTNAIYACAELALWLRRWRMPGGSNALFNPPTATKNVGLISGGAAPNVVPGRCELQLDLRYLPGTDAHELLAAISNTIGRLERKFPGAIFEVETTQEDVPTAIATDAPLYRALESAILAVRGRRPKPFGMSGATVAKQFLAAGIPAVGLSPGDSGVAHCANEYISADALVDFAAVLAICLTALTGRNK